jgi:hypothetical protein
MYGVQVQRFTQGQGTWCVLFGTESSRSPSRASIRLSTKLVSRVVALQGRYYVALMHKGGCTYLLSVGMRGGLTVPKPSGHGQERHGHSTDAGVSNRQRLLLCVRAGLF